MSAIKFFAIAIALVLALMMPAAAEDPGGDWAGAIKTPNGELHVAVHLQKGADGTYSGTFDSLDQGVRGLPVSDVKPGADTLSFALVQPPARYEGKWDAASKTWIGIWLQNGASMPLNFTRGSPAAPPSKVEGLDGDWDGALQTSGMRLRLALHVKTTATLGTVATMDSIDQAATGIPVSAISRDGNAVSFDVALVHGGFKGTLDASGQTITGQWSQGTPLPLTLTRRAPGVQQQTLNRPQTPVKPYPYREEEVTFEDAGVHLAGTLTLPKGAGPFPAVVLIAGSGPQTRNENVFGHQIFLILADHLTRQGIAVLRFDKRGIGASKGDYGKATTEDFANDAQAAFTFLKTHADIDPHHVGLIGHSEGGLIAPIVAARDSSVAFIVLMAGPGVDGARILSEQGRLIGKAMGMSDDQNAKMSAMRDQAIAIVRTEKYPAVAEAKVRSLMETAGLPKFAVDMQVKFLTSDWMRLFFTMDPAVALRQVRCPVLAIGGSKDLQVPATESLAAIKTALSNNPDVDVRELPNLNHLFQTAQTGSLGEYAESEETISPSVLTLISSWILERAHRR
jgi:fermentation-respiration switch protein FrsA (DUF1100 family)